MSICCLLGMPLLAMQQQKQIQTQDQDFAPIKKKKDSDGKKPVPTPIEVPSSDLQAQLAALMNSVASTYGSVDGLVDQMMKKHERVCSCGKLSSQCVFDQQMVRQGIIYPCYCGFCKGRENRL